MSRSLIILILALLTTSLSCHSAAQMFQTASTAGQTLATTKLHFPEPWVDATRPPFPLSSIQDIEVRKAPNASANEFLFAALPHGANDYWHEVDHQIPAPEYSKNSFVVSFSDQLKVRTAAQQEWEGASRIVSKSRFVLYSGGDDSAGEIEYRGKKFPKVGKYWGRGLLSPGGKWLAIFSYTAVKPPPDILFGSSPRSGDVFWEIYDTVTGQKVFAWQAKNVTHPTSLDGPVVWLEERYFLFPEDEDAQNFLVIALPEFTPETNPVTVRLPPRIDDKGERVPAASRQEAWTPLIPLTKEEAARITAPSQTEITEVRSSAQLLLLAIREETENRTRSRGGVDGAGDYNYRVFSTYYYAVSLNDTTQSRAASKEEWERGRVLKSNHHEISLDDMTDTFMGKRRTYRPFPKTGAAWGSPMALSGGEWIAVFSYTQQQGASPAGKLFVDIYERRPGNKFLSSELPYTGSPNALFGASLWVEDGYLLVPLNTSFDSFVLWTLPGGV